MKNANPQAEFFATWLIATLGMWWVLTIGQIVIEIATCFFDCVDIAPYIGWGRLVLSGALAFLATAVYLGNKSN